MPRWLTDAFGAYVIFTILYIFLRWIFKLVLGESASEQPVSTILAFIIVVIPAILANAYNYVTSEDKRSFWLLWPAMVIEIIFFNYTSYVGP